MDLSFLSWGGLEGGQVGQVEVMGEELTCWRNSSQSSAHPPVSASATSGSHHNPHPHAPDPRRASALSELPGSRNGDPMETYVRLCSKRCTQVLLPSQHPYGFKDEETEAQGQSKW